MSRPIGYLKPRGVGFGVVCADCRDALRERAFALGDELPELSPVFKENVLPYRQSCADCGKVLVAGQSPAWPELYDSGRRGGKGRKAPRRRRGAPSRGTVVELLADSIIEDLKTWAARGVVPRGARTLADLERVSSGSFDPHDLGTLTATYDEIVQGDPESRAWQRSGERFERLADAAWRRVEKWLQAGGLTAAAGGRGGKGRKSPPARPAPGYRVVLLGYGTWDAQSPSGRRGETCSTRDEAVAWTWRDHSAARGPRRGGKGRGSRAAALAASVRKLTR